jgi:hypothetical protein
VSIVDRLPFGLGRSVTGGAVTTLGTAAYDFALGGQAFLSASNDEMPYTRGLAPIRKDQFDNNREPGEQSLANWWLRSQSTFIGGEGILYQDPDQVSVANLQNRHTIQFGHSVGLNPWVNGKLTLLRSTTQRVADASGLSHFVLGWKNGGADSFYSAFGTSLKSDDGTTTTNVAWGGVNNIDSLASDGTHYFVADSVGIWSGTGTGAGAKAWNTGSANVVITWAKGRLMGAVDNKVYELVGGAPPALPTPKFTHLNSSFVFTAFAEGTNAIYAAGYAGNKSEIYKFTLDTTGVVPTLANGGIQACQMPSGEIVYSIYAYLGSFIGIGTNRGFRVGQIDPDTGDIVYGPLLFPTPSGQTGIQAIAAYDRFFFVGVPAGIDTFSGLYRVDLSQPIYDNGTSASLRFAYATDLQTHLTGAVTGVTNFGTSDRMVIGQVGQGAYLESATVLEPTGYFNTGRIRYNTLEPKIFKFLTVRMPGTYFGTVAASVFDPTGTQTSVLTVAEASGQYITDIGLSGPSSATEWLQVRLDFTRSLTSNALGPEVNGWQLKAIPGAIRQRVFQVPLVCFDREADHNGQWDGYEGRTLDRLERFEQLAQKGDSVVFQDLALQRSWTVIVDDYQFIQKANPGNNRNGYGGYLTVQLRTIADVVS